MTTFSPRLISLYFKGRSYRNTNELLQHLSQLSREIKVHPFKKTKQNLPRQLNSFHKLVYQIALSLPQGPSQTGIAREIIKQQSGTEVEKPDSKLVVRVQAALYVLRGFGLLSKTKITRVARPRSSFSQAVMEIAPRFRTFKGERYDHLAIANEMAVRDGKALEEMSTTESRKLQSKVNKTIQLLVASGHLARTHRPPSLPRLRTATPEEVVKHLHFIDEVLRSRHPWVYNWKDHLDQSEAQEYGRRGLTAAIEKYDGRPGGSFRIFAKKCIARAIGARLHGLRRKKVVRSMDQLQGTEDTTLHDRLATPAVNPEILQTQVGHLLTLHKRGIIKPHHLALWALERFGHSQQEMASFFKTSREAVRKNILVAEKRIAATPSKPHMPLKK